MRLLLLGLVVPKNWIKPERTHQISCLIWCLPWRTNWLRSATHCASPIPPAWYACAWGGMLRCITQRTRSGRTDATRGCLKNDGLASGGGVLGGRLPRATAAAGRPDVGGARYHPGFTSVDGYCRQTGNFRLEKHHLAPSCSSLFTFRWAVLSTTTRRFHFRLRLNNSHFENTITSL